MNRRQGRQSSERSRLDAPNGRRCGPGPAQRQRASGGGISHDAGSSSDLDKLASRTVGMQPGSAILHRLELAKPKHVIGATWRSVMAFDEEFRLGVGLAGRNGCAALTIKVQAAAAEWWEREARHRHRNRRGSASACGQSHVAGEPGAKDLRPGGRNSIVPSLEGEREVAWGCKPDRALGWEAFGYRICERASLPPQAQQLPASHSQWPDRGLYFWRA